MAGETGTKKMADRELWDYLDRSHCWMRFLKKWKIGADGSDTAFASGDTARLAVESAMAIRPYREKAATGTGTTTRALRAASPIRRPRKARAPVGAGTSGE